MHPAKQLKQNDIIDTNKLPESRLIQLILQFCIKSHVIPNEISSRSKFYSPNISKIVSSLNFP